MFIYHSYHSISVLTITSHLEMKNSDHTQNFSLLAISRRPLALEDTPEKSNIQNLPPITSAYITGIVGPNIYEDGEYSQSVSFTLRAQGNKLSFVFHIKGRKWPEDDVRVFYLTCQRIITFCRKFIMSIRG